MAQFRDVSPDFTIGRVMLGGHRQSIERVPGRSQGERAAPESHSCVSCRVWSLTSHVSQQQISSAKSDRKQPSKTYYVAVPTRNGCIKSINQSSYYVTYM